MKYMNHCDNVVSIAKPHTIKKFELIEKYVKEWSQKLCNNTYCNNLVFIDCMSNSGEYIDIDGRVVYGTPVRVSNVLREVAGQYPGMNINVYFNDIDSKRTQHLSSLIPSEKDNFHVHISTGDGNDLLKRMSQVLLNAPNTHFLLVYDPYKATIDWEAIAPFFNRWGEVIINHMVSDSIRAVKMAKTEDAVKKYKMTYLAELENLILFGNDRNAYEKRVEEIINKLHLGQRSYYIASFPFFNSRNAIVYNLIHCTTNINGFKLYKKIAWQVFDGKSSTKDTHGNENQLEFNWEDNSSQVKNHVDESCYYIKDIADYLQRKFCGQEKVPLVKLWEALDNHPVFPSDGFRNDIKKDLKNIHFAIVSRDTVSFKE